MTPSLKEFLSASALSYRPLPSYQGKALALLDLRQNPATGTTKTFASLVIVARAVRYIQATGQRVTIVTPSSANKATAMRDAVLRALTCGLVMDDQLNVVVVVPRGAETKLRRSRLSDDPQLAARNPVTIHRGAQPGDVKAVAQSAARLFQELPSPARDTNLWYTLQLENYLAADVVRALFEVEFLPSAMGARLHAHAVSSAYGLLGHACGRRLFCAGKGEEPHYLLVQHLGAPDMVLSLYHSGSTADEHRPRYGYSEDSGLYVQDRDPHFPSWTHDPFEILDPTFYTRNPATSAEMDSLIHQQGGAGIVVSRAECLDRYPQIRSLLAAADVALPADPAALREWSLVMAVTGVLNAVDRGLVAEDEILIHGSGSYSEDDYVVLPDENLRVVDDAGSLLEVLMEACSG
jgi:hypothetical protein